MEVLKLFCIVSISLSQNVLSQQNNCYANIPLLSQNSNEVTRLTKNTDYFGLSLFKSLANSTPKSIFFSPYGIWSALALGYLGSEGATKEQLGKTLGLGSNKDVAFSAIGKLGFQ